MTVCKDLGFLDAGGLGNDTGCCEQGVSCVMDYEAWLKSASCGLHIPTVHVLTRVSQRGGSLNQWSVISTEGRRWRCFNTDMDGERWWELLNEEAEGAHSLVK
jgi:hypothetical protein